MNISSLAKDVAKWARLKTGSQVQSTPTLDFNEAVELATRRRLDLYNKQDDISPRDKIRLRVPSASTEKKITATLNKYAEDTTEWAMAGQRLTRDELISRLFRNQVNSLLEGMPEMPAAWMYTPKRVTPGGRIRRKVSHEFSATTLMRGNTGLGIDAVSFWVSAKGRRFFFKLYITPGGVWSLDRWWAFRGKYMPFIDTPFLTTKLWFLNNTALMQAALSTIRERFLEVNGSELGGSEDELSELREISRTSRTKAKCT